MYNRQQTKSNNNRNRKNRGENNNNNIMAVIPPSSTTKNDSSAFKKGQIIVTTMRGNLLRSTGIFLFLALVICFSNVGEFFGGTGGGGDTAMGGGGGVGSIKTSTVRSRTKNNNNNNNNNNQMITPEDVFRIPDLSTYENCTIQWIPPSPKSEWTTQPLWLTGVGLAGSASHSGQGDLLKPIINSITGLKNGNKNYINSNKNLRRCHGIDETAACSISSAMATTGGVGVLSQTSSSHSSILYVIRNYRDSFPADFFDKDLKYRNMIEQRDEESWRNVRDDWFQEGGVNHWIQNPFWWIQSDQYTIGMYIQYEKLLNVETGPEVVERLAQELHKAGFNRAPSEDIPCIWYQAVKNEWKRQKDFYKYVPGYTSEQIQMMLTYLKEGIQNATNSKDEHLTAIFKEYYTEIQSHTKVDRPWNNTSTTDGG